MNLGDNMKKGKKQNFSFIKYLTNRDIEKILTPLNIEIMKRKNSDKLRILRGKDENGNRYITVFAKDNNPDETKEMRDVVMKEMMKLPSFRGFMANIFMSSVILQSMNPGFSQFDNTVILRFEDYFLTEGLSLKTEEQKLEFDRKLTKNYQNYMTKKFGRFYNSMKSAYYKKLHKEIREEEAQNQEAEQAEENNEEIIEK